MTYCHNMQDTWYRYLIWKCQNWQKMHLRGLVITATIWHAFICFFYQIWREHDNAIFATPCRIGWRLKQSGSLGICRCIMVECYVYWELISQTFKCHCCTCWCRVKVHQLVKDSPQKAKVYFVDSGRKKELPCDQLIVLPEKLANAPHQVVNCKYITK